MISIIIPIHNTKIEDLEDCVKSISNQTYDNFEVLFIENGSQKEYIEAVDRIAKWDERFYVFHLGNVGVSSARNFGTQQSKGDYIMYVDGDDLLAVDALEDGINLIEKTDSDVVIGKILKTTERPQNLTNSLNNGYTMLDSISKIRSFKRHILTKNVAEWKLEQGFEYNGEGCWSHLIKRQIALNNSFIPGVEVGEDTIWALNMLDEKKPPKICLSEKLWYYYIQNEYSVLSKYNERIVEQLTKPVSILSPVFLNESDDLYNAYMRWIMSKLKQIIFRYYLAKENKNSFKNKKHLMKKMISSEPWAETIKDKRSLPFSMRLKLFLYRKNLMLTLFVIKNPQIIFDQYN